VSPRSHDVVVVGGGIVGTAIAYYLAENGVSDVVLVEQSILGSGTTGGSAGGVRQQFATELEIEMSRRGLAFWKSVEARFDSPCPFHEDGYLLLTGQASVAEEFGAASELQRRAGLNEIQLVEPEHLTEIAPWLSGEGLVVGSWSPRDGHMTPTDGVSALARAARAKGVEIRENWPVTRIDRGAEGWELIGRDVLLARRLVVAAGYWTPELIRPLGHDLDIRLNVQYQVLTEPIFPGERVPITIDVDSGLFVEREGPGLALAVIGRTPQLTSHQEVLYEFIRRAQIRAPGLLNVRIAKEVTLNPAIGGDGAPYVGELEPGLWTCCFVGHGAMHGPPVAELVARELAGNSDPTVDMSAWDPHRKPARRNSVWWRRPEPDYVRRALAVAT
jgi:sarcosine oxidase subunit beta